MSVSGLLPLTDLSLLISSHSFVVRGHLIVVQDGRGGGSMQTINSDGEPAPTLRVRGSGTGAPPHFLIFDDVVLLFGMYDTEQWKSSFYDQNTRNRTSGAHGGEAMHVSSSPLELHSHHHISSFCLLSAESWHACRLNFRWL